MAVSIASGIGLKVENLRKEYSGVAALNDISFEVDAGMFATLVGPSGCGKTTTLKILAGLLQPTQGTVYLKDRDITFLSPQERPCCLVFQNLALFPHLTVEKNISYPMKLRKTGKAESARKVSELMELVDLPQQYRGKTPGQMSGGEQQRVALARALAYDPEILLLDEPLASIDFKLQIRLRKVLKDMHAKVKKTFIYVTHSLEEALTLSQKLIVMKDGNIVQIGTPEEVYSNPRNRFVAEFMGDANTFVVQKADEKSGYTYLSVDGFEQQFLMPSSLVSGDKGYLIVRSGFISLSQTEKTGRNSLRVKVFNKYVKGTTIEYALDVNRAGFQQRITCEQAVKHLMSDTDIYDPEPGVEAYAHWEYQDGIFVQD